MPAESHVAEPQLNATPLIDVLLVLLVMLIFTLPVMTHAVKLNLPRGPMRGDVPEIIQLEVAFDGVVSWNDRPIASLVALETRLRDLGGMDPAPFVHLRADPRCPYEPVAQVLAATQRAHVRNLSIVSLSTL